MHKNCEEAIKKLMDEEGIKTQKDLLREMHKKINNKEFRRSDAPECEEWVEKNESNFSSMKKGERGFPLEFRYALSEISGKSFSEFIKDKKEERKDDAPFGIRYAVYKDQEKFYRKLLEPRNEDGELWIDGTEYNKDILDYVVERKAVNGLKFLLKEPSFDWHLGLKTELLSWAIELDDLWIFKKLMDKLWMRDYIDKDVFYDCDSEQIYDMILKSRNIIQFFSTPVKKENDFSISGCLPYAFGFLLSRAIINEDNEIVDKLFAIYEKYVQDQIKAFLESQGFAHQRDIHDISNGYRDSFTYLRTIGFSKGIILINFECSDNAESFKYLSECYKERFTSLLPDEVKKSICEGPKSLSNGGEYIDRIHRKIYRRREPCLGYDMMKLMTYDNSVSNIVRFYGDESEDGVLVSELERHEGHYYGDYSIRIKLSKLIPIFSEIHRISEHRLGKGQVYSYLDYEKIVPLKREGREEFVLGGWIDNSRICSPEDALIDLTLSYIEELGYDRKSAEEIGEMQEAFSKYYDKSHIDNLGDRLLEELQRRIGKLDKKIAVGEYERLMHAQTFVNLYIDELNNLS